MPESLGLVDRLRGRGVPALISGAGPSVLAFTTSLLDDQAGLLEATPEGWSAIPQRVGGPGARVLP